MEIVKQILAYGGVGMAVLFVYGLFFWYVPWIGGAPRRENWLLVAGVHGIFGIAAWIAWSVNYLWGL